MKLPLISTLIEVILLCILLPGTIGNSCSPGDWTEGTDPSQCKPCIAGCYCPYLSATQPAQGTNEVGCPQGTYVSYTGAVSVDECLKCDLGMYTPSTGYSTCWKCPHGTYCDTKGTKAPTDCPAGTYQPNEGATSIQDCLTCPAGTLHPLTGGYECYPCPDGYTCNDPAQTPIPIATTSSSNTASSTNIIQTSALSTTKSSLTSPLVTAPIGISTVVTPTAVVPSVGLISSSVMTPGGSSGTQLTVDKCILMIMYVLNIILIIGY